MPPRAGNGRVSSTWNENEKVSAPALEKCCKRQQLDYGRNNGGQECELELKSRDPENGHHTTRDLNGMYGHFARVLVEVDLSMPLNGDFPRC